MRQRYNRGSGWLLYVPGVIHIERGGHNLFSNESGIKNFQMLKIITFVKRLYRGASIHNIVKRAVFIIFQMLM